MKHTKKEYKIKKFDKKRGCHKEIIEQWKGERRNEAGEMYSLMI